jgi:phage regulator Rha-like protein
VVAYAGYYSPTAGKGEKVMAGNKPLIVIEDIESKILTMRGQKVMLDADLAELYGVETRSLNQAVKRNAERFPEDFMFQLTDEEHESLRSQFVILKTGRGQHRKYMPYAFTEHGALMLGNVLKSERAVEVSLHVVRAFVHLREMISGHKELSRKLDELERKVSSHDQAIAGLIHAIREMMTPHDPKKKRPIGFAPWKEK